MMNVMGGTGIECQGKEGQAGRRESKSDHPQQQGDMQSWSSLAKVIDAMRSTSHTIEKVMDANV